MTKRSRKAKLTDEERAEREADRLAAHGLAGPNVQVAEFDDRVSQEDHGIAHETFREMNSDAAIHEDAGIEANAEPGATPQVEGNEMVVFADEEAKDAGDGAASGDDAGHSEDGGVDGDVGTVEGEGEEEPPKVSSVVKDKFKDKYIENAKALGIPGKAAKRSNWDWLSQQLATFCLNDKHSIDIGAFTDVLDANGVDHSRWTNRNRGWEGRFRMTGRVALQKVVANSGLLKWPGGSETEVPAEFREKYKTKA